MDRSRPADTISGVKHICNNNNLSICRNSPAELSAYLRIRRHKRIYEVPLKVEHIRLTLVHGHDVSSTLTHDYQSSSNCHMYTEFTVILWRRRLKRCHEVPVSVVYVCPACTLVAIDRSPVLTDHKDVFTDGYGDAKARMFLVIRGMERLDEIIIDVVHVDVAFVDWFITWSTLPHKNELIVGINRKAKGSYVCW